MCASSFQPTVDVRLALLATVLSVAGSTVVALVTSVTDWDRRVAEGVFPFGDDASLFVLVALIDFLLFSTVLLALSANRQALGGALLDLAEDSILISRAAGVALWPPLLFTIGSAAAAPAAYLGYVTPWLWAATAIVALGLILTAIAPIPKHAPRSVPSDPEPEPSLPDTEKWWQELIESPIYHGQVHRVRTLPGRQPESDRPARDLPPELEAPVDIYRALIGPNRPIRRFVLTAFEILLGSAAGRSQDGRLCIVDLPNGAGLTTMIATLAIHNRLGQHRRTIVLAPDSARSINLERRLREFVERDIRSRGMIRVSEVHSSRQIETLGAQNYEDIPDILVVDPYGLHMILQLAAREPWSHFFASLGFVTVNGSYGFVGAPGAHIAMLLRRLEATWRRAGMSPAYLVGCTTAIEQIPFLTALLGRKDIGRDLIVTDDATPRRQVEIVGWIPNLQVTPPPRSEVTRRSFLGDVCALASSATLAGLRTLVVRAESAIADSDLIALRGEIERSIELEEKRVSLEVVASVTEGRRRMPEYDIVVYAGFPTSWVALVHEVSLLGTEREGGAKYVILVAPHDPASLNFIRRQLGDSTPAAPAPALEVANEEILQIHLRALIRSVPLLPTELAILGGVEPFLDKWFLDGLLEYDETTRVGTVVPEQATEYFRPTMDLEATGEAITQVVDINAQNEEVTRVDPGRAYLIGYPGALVVIDGKRYMVGPSRSNTISVEPMDLPDQITHPISQVAVSLSEGVAAPASIQASSGAVRIDAQHVKVKERVIGYRTWRISEPESPGKMKDIKDTPCERPEFETTATIFGFPEWQNPPSEAALHTLAHALRVTAPLYVHYRQEDLGMVVMKECPWMGNSPALLLYDNTSSGIGIEDQLRPRLMDKLLPACYELLTSCPCEDGCPACVSNPRCKRAGGLEDLDKVGALRLIADLLNLPEQAEADISRRSSPKVDDSYIRELAFLADSIAKDILGPMLDIHIPRLPEIYPEPDLPNGVLGLYSGPENVIRIRPMSKRRAVAVLAHELAHAWSLQPGGFSPSFADEEWPLSGNLFLEGFAQWVEFKTLDHFGFRAEVSEISGWPPDEYGVGFRLFNFLEENDEIGGVQGVRRFVSDPDAEWLQEYFGSALYRGEMTAIKSRTKDKTPEPDWTPPPVDEGQETGDDVPEGADEAAAGADSKGEHVDSDEEPADVEPETTATTAEAATPEDARAESGSSAEGGEAARSEVAQVDSEGQQAAVRPKRKRKKRRR